MKYTFKEIQEKRYDPKRPKERIWSEKFIPLNFIGKILSPYFTFVFLNLNIHPDFVTFASLVFILFGFIAFLFGYAIYGIIFYLLFLLFDSIDGDMARCAGPTKYGGIIDSFGADLFYALTPISIGYFLFIQELNIGIIMLFNFLLIGSLVSVLFLFYRLINFKLNSYRKSNPSQSSNISQYGDRNEGKIIYKIIKLYRHVLIKGNFFAEPGMVFWFTIFIFFKSYYLLSIYLISILLYNIGYTFINLVVAYKYFVNNE